MGNGARMDGIECNLFFTFFGLEAIQKGKNARIKVATVGNPGMHIPTVVGALPGMSAMATWMMQKKMEALDIPPIPEFVTMIADAGGKLYACKASVDMFGLTKDDFVPEVDRILTVGDFYNLAGGGQIIFT
jgi:peroxiredoxin family protein